MADQGPAAGDGERPRRRSGPQAGGPEPQDSTATSVRHHQRAVQHQLDQKGVCQQGQVDVRMYVVSQIRH